MGFTDPTKSLSEIVNKNAPLAMKHDSPNQWGDGLIALSTGIFLFLQMSKWNQCSSILAKYCSLAVIRALEVDEKEKIIGTEL